MMCVVEQRKMIAVNFEVRSREAAIGWLDRHVGVANREEVRSAIVNSSLPRLERDVPQPSILLVGVTGGLAELDGAAGMLLESIALMATFEMIEEALCPSASRR